MSVDFPAWAVLGGYAGRTALATRPRPAVIDEPASKAGRLLAGLISRAIERVSGRSDERRSTSRPWNFVVHWLVHQTECTVYLISTVHRSEEEECRSSGRLLGSVRPNWAPMEDRAKPALICPETSQRGFPMCHRTLHLTRLNAGRPAERVLAGLVEVKWSSLNHAVQSRDTQKTGPT